jgi:antitoxin HigA-1
MALLEPIHPGEILMEEFLKPLELSQYRLAKDIGVPPIRINDIIHGKRSITADTALRLSTYFQTTPEFWMNLQNHYDLENRKNTLGKILKIEVKVYHATQVESKLQGTFA